MESVKALLSLFVSNNQEEAKGKRTLAMSYISRAHIRGVLVRRVFVEIPRRREREVRTRERTRSGIRWLAEEVYVWHRRRQCSLASALRADPERVLFRSRSQQSLIICVRVTRCSTAGPRRRLHGGGVQLGGEMDTTRGVPFG